MEKNESSREKENKLSEKHEKTFDRLLDPQYRLYKQLEEIEKEQLFLRKRKALLLKEKPWYLKPSNWIGISAVLISVISLLVYIVLTYERKELTFSYTKPASLILFTPAMKSKVNITFDDQPILNLCRTTIRLANTGTKAIQSTDFMDGPITFRIFPQTTAQNITSRNNVPLLLEVTNRSTAGQTHAQLNIISRENPATFTYLPSLLNTNDMVEFEIYTSSTEQLKITAEGKIVEGEIILAGVSTKFDSSPLSTSIPKRIFILVFQLLGGKFLTIFLLLILFIASASISLIIWDGFGPPEEFVEYVIVGISLVFNILLLLGLVLAFLT